MPDRRLRLRASRQVRVHFAKESARQRMTQHSTTVGYTLEMSQLNAPPYYLFPRS